MSRLEKFLMNRGLLEEFKSNFKFNSSPYYSYGCQNLEEHLLNPNESRLIIDSFNWRHTKGGYYFWENIDKEWRDCLKTDRL